MAAVSLSADDAGTPLATPGRGDARTLTVVSIAHGCSHFFHLIVAPLFPWLKVEFGLSYAELGLLMTVFFVVSGVGQAGAGFLVDRIGAVPMMLASLLAFVLASATLALAPGYAMLMLGCMFAGLGNASFHPVDYSILNARIAPARLARAYAIHSVAGNLGWALAPVFLVGLTGLANWRVAIAAAGALAAVILIMVWRHRSLLAGAPVDRLGLAHTAPGDTTAPTSASASVSAEPALAFLRLPAVWMSFVFFFTLAISFGGLQTFGPEAARLLHGVAPAWVALCLTAYMLASAVGTLAGGWLAGDPARAESVVAVGFGFAACMSLVLALVALPGWAVPTLFALMGFGSGTAGPARDLLVRRASPPGATGRVYGLVYSGLDAGMAIAPAVFGWMMDHRMPGGVWLGIALFQGLLIANALSVARAGQRTLRPA
jgi:MFS transporter, FSR family, fosmidomycin resistance protein